MDKETNYITAHKAIQLEEEGKVEVYAEMQGIVHGKEETIDFSLSDYNLSEVEGMACDERYKFFID